MVHHRKRIKHHEQQIAVHELTFSCYRRLPLLTNDRWRAMLAESITRAMTGHDYELIAFVFMPEHVHLLVLPKSESSRVSNLLNAIKRPYSFRIKKLLQQSNSPLLEKLTIRQRPGVMTFRYWQEGPGYDRNLESAEAIEAAINYIHLNPVRRELCAAARRLVLVECPSTPETKLRTWHRPSMHRPAQLRIVLIVKPLPDTGCHCWLAQQCPS